MKITKLFFSLILILIAIASSAYSQDSRINIGKSYLRYDSDSNKLRLGGNPVPKLAREFDAQLFDFNPSQFLWDRTKGLCLSSLNSYDSSKIKKLIIYSDTGDGEIIPYRSRSYNIFKPYYSNSPDLYDLLVQYISYNDISGKSMVIDINLFNTTTTLFENLPQQDISGVGFAPILSQFPRKGNYLVTLSYEYEYINAIDDGQEDINVVITYNSIELRNYHHRWRHAKSSANEIRLASCITFPISVNDVQQVLQIAFFGNTALSSRIYLYNLSISAVLIN